jgi:hypothetical protein
LGGGEKDHARLASTASASRITSGSGIALSSMIPDLLRSRRWRSLREEIGANERVRLSMRRARSLRELRCCCAAAAAAAAAALSGSVEGMELGCRESLSHRRSTSSNSLELPPELERWRTVGGAAVGRSSSLERSEPGIDC